MQQRSIHYREKSRIVVRRKARRQLERAARRVSSTPLGNLAVAKKAYRGLASILETPVSDTPVWITYEGYQLKVEPEGVGEVLIQKGEFEPKVTAFIDQSLSAGGTAVDVGAHIGHHTLTMRRSVGRSGKIIAIEPHPAKVNLLRETITKNDFDNVEIIQSAVTDETGTATLYAIPERTGKSRLDRPSGDYEKTYSVDSTTLTEILNDLNVGDVDVLKMDIEGGELDALDELDTESVSVEKMLIEVHPGVRDGYAEELYEQCSEMRELTFLNGETITSPAMISNRAGNKHIVVNNPAEKER